MIHLGAIGQLERVQRLWSDVLIPEGVFREETGSDPEQEQEQEENPPVAYDSASRAERHRPRLTHSSGS